MSLPPGRMAPANPPSSSLLARVRLPRALWRGRSLRWQLLATIGALHLLGACAGLALAVLGARAATEAEVASSLAAAEGFVRESVERAGRGADTEALLAELPLLAAGLRHVRVVVEDAQGRPVLSPRPAADRAGTVPGWFAALVGGEARRRAVPVERDGARVATVVVSGAPDDEIAEAWGDLSALALPLAAVWAGVGLALALAFGRLLGPLTGLAHGLRALEDGRYRHRLPRPAVRELAAIVDRFNALATAYGAAQADNAALTRRLVTLQDDERRQIALELHDEIGPCLFGIQANAASIGRLARRAPEPLAADLAERAEALGEITARIQSLNRALLRRLRPMALGHVPLAEVLGELVADFTRLHPGPKVAFHRGALAAGYGDDVDLTLHRCLQEALTNAGRHAGARTVAIELGEEPGPGARPGGEGAARLLRLRVEDDGQGLPAGMRAGYGLTGIEERVRALGGTVAVSGRAGGGTLLDIAVPLEAAAGPVQALGSAA